jgi:hypothetical protein
VIFDEGAQWDWSSDTESNGSFTV